MFKLSVKDPRVVIFLVIFFSLLGCKSTDVGAIDDETGEPVAEAPGDDENAPAGECSGHPMVGEWLGSANGTSDILTINEDCSFSRSTCSEDGQFDQGPDISFDVLPSNPTYSSDIIVVRARYSLNSVHAAQPVADMINCNKTTGLAYDTMIVVLNSNVTDLDDTVRFRVQDGHVAPGQMYKEITYTRH